MCNCLGQNKTNEAFLSPKLDERSKQQSNIGQFFMLFLLWFECSLLCSCSSCLPPLPQHPQAAARPGSFSTATPQTPFPSLSPPQYLLHMFSLVLVDLPDGVELAVTRPGLFVQTGQTAFPLGCQANQTGEEQPFSFCSSARCIRGTTAPNLQAAAAQAGWKNPACSRPVALFNQGALLMYRKRNP